MIPLICIYVGGVLSLLMAFFHTRFYKMFNWKTEFEKLSLANSRILYTIHIALLLIFIVIGVISIIYAKELSHSIGLSVGLNFLLSIFWLWRFIWQLTYFRVEKGQKSPPISILLSVIFILLFVSYFIPFLYRFLA
jgi:hypothetical protein